MQNLTAYSDAIIFTGETFVENHALIIGDGKIIDIIGMGKRPADARAISFRDKILAPGFIDVQVNGGGNVMLNNTPTAEACLTIAAAHRKYGTTHILPTCITDRPEITQSALQAVREARQKDPSILGIHLEGPHLGQARRGVHKSEHLRAISESDLALYQRAGNEVMLMTIAPECVSTDQIKKLKSQGVIISIGHTQATSDETRAALAAGATGFTHLFNAMGGLNARDNGPANIALDDRDSWCGLIADGFHVSAEMIRLALRAKQGHVFLVSDAMPPSATDKPQPFQLYGETIHADGGRCVNSEGKLAGAVLTLLEAARNCTQKFGVELGEALRMASLYPAGFLGLDKSFGKLLPGFQADVISLSPDLSVADHCRTT